jgi:hypothetical protein
MTQPFSASSAEQSQEVLALLQVLALGEAQIKKKQAIPVKLAFAHIRQRIHLHAKKREPTAG